MPAIEPFITIRAVQPVVAALEALGHPVGGLLQEIGIPRALLDDADGRVPHRAMMQLWARALERSADQQLGLHVGEAAPIGSFELHAYAMQSSATLREAFRRGCRYQRLIHEATDLVFEETSGEGVLRHALPGGRPVPRHPAEFLATVWLRLGRAVTGTDWAPSLVCFAHPEPADTREHQRVFRAPVRFSSPGTAMHVPGAVLDIPNPRADAGLLHLLERHANALLEHAPRRAALSERVRAHLVQTLGEPAPTAAQVARAMHLSLRTLNRELQAEGTSFRRLHEQFRHERAVALLADPRCSIAEAGFLLGFSEISSFYRAFKRWTGRTPAEVRAEALRRPEQS